MGVMVCTFTVHCILYIDMMKVYKELEMHVKLIILNMEYAFVQNILHFAHTYIVWHADIMNTIIVAYTLHVTWLQI